ncbi:unnamed protein product [Callosobruchus maculatus]|uniref:Uncharacterized protein n=1 Tax=Callosobruchus maculatus TaxID=64391 RepID=A0A653C8W3_CALMS|nr:unnamed protein product [Callosobruchus maculatus]
MRSIPIEEEQDLINIFPTNCFISILTSFLFIASFSVVLRKSFHRSESIAFKTFVSSFRSILFERVAQQMLLLEQK